MIEEETLVMPANNTSRFLRRLARRYPGTIGHLFSPGAQRAPFPCTPYALDNGCFTDWNPRRSPRRSFSAIVMPNCSPPSR